MFFNRVPITNGRLNLGPQQVIVVLKLSFIKFVYDEYIQYVLLHCLTTTNC
jgi:hypothetical protein